MHSIAFHGIYISKTIVWKKIKRIWKLFHCCLQMSDHGYLHHQGWCNICNKSRIRCCLHFFLFLTWRPIYLQCGQWYQLVVLLNIAVGIFPFTTLVPSCFYILKLSGGGLPFTTWQSILWSVFVLKSKSSQLATFSKSFASIFYGNKLLSSSPLAFGDTGCAAYG